MTEKNNTTNNQILKTDVLIIGAGPVGLFAIFECGMLKMKCHVVDSLDAVGGQCVALYPEKPIYDIAGFPSIDAADLISNLEAQAAPFSPIFHLGQQLVEVKKTADGFYTKTSIGTEIECKAIIIAAGCGAFGPNRPPLANLEAFEKAGDVNYFVKNKADYEGKNVIIAGGGDSAVDWANIIGEIANKTYVLHRRDKFRAAPESVDKMKALEAAGKIEMLVPYQLAGIEGQGGALQKVIVTDFENNNRVVDANKLICFYGLAMELGPIANWGLNLHHTRIEVDPSNMQTNIEGIYAAGDICDYKGKLKLIVNGFGEAATAAHNAYEKVFNKPFHFEYSTSKGVPNN